MQWQEYQICGKVYSVLELCELDEDELRQSQAQCKDIRNVEISLSCLPLLQAFARIEILILTSGMATAADLEYLYQCRYLEKLVLHYEETDSNEDGILLSRFDSLHYVLSLSNLNIRNAEPLPEGLTLDVLNYYRQGKCLRRGYDGINSPLRISRSFFFSTEAEGAAARPLMEILTEFEKFLNRRMRSGYYTTELDKIAVIPVCMSQRMLNAGFGKERKRVCHRKREADIRLQIDYDVFLTSSYAKRVRLCKACILNAAAYICTKDTSFCVEAFVADVEYIAQSLSLRN